MRASGPLLPTAAMHEQGNYRTRFPSLRMWVFCGVISRNLKEAQRRDLTGFAVSVSRFWTVLDHAHRLSLIARVFYECAALGSIPIPHSINLDAVGLTGFPPLKVPSNCLILDAVGRENTQNSKVDKISPADRCRQSRG